jgi:hypothetical protein
MGWKISKEVFQIQMDGGSEELRMLL